MVSEITKPEADTKKPNTTDTAEKGVGESPKPDVLDTIRSLTHGAEAKTTVADATPLKTAEGGREKPVTAEDGFSITDDSGRAPGKDEGGKGKVEVLPSLKPTFDPEKIADSLENKMNGGWTLGAGTDEAGVFNDLKDLTPEQIKLVDNKFAEKYGVNYAKDGQRWGLEQEFKDEMSGPMLDRGLAILKQKSEIPAESLVKGEDTLKEGADLKVGETNRVTMGDGRKYDIYVPPNAQKPLPVMLVMHGASNGNDQANQRIMENESGMNRVADQMGFAVVYAYAEPRPVEGLLGIEQQPSSWNMQGHKNFLPTDKSYDDGKYLDRVLSDVGARVTVDNQRVGVAGMSDGGRAAEQYVLDRPGKFSALTVMHGTWMNGEERPTSGNGLPMMEIHGTKDKMLPWEQGESGWFGEKGLGMMSWLASSFIPGTTDSRPKQQVEVFKDANACEGEPTVTKVDDVTSTKYSAEQCKTGSVEFKMIDGGSHAWHDWRNPNGWMFVGMPNREQGFSKEAADFILKHKARRGL